MDMNEKKQQIAEDLLYSPGEGDFLYRQREDMQIEATEYDGEGNVVETYVVSINLHAVTPGQ